jgi:hypothetical protein
VTERLVDDFVSTWVFFKDLPALAESGSSERVRAAAAVCRREGLQPVDSLVISPAGVFLGGFWVDDLGDWGERPDFVSRPKPPYQGSEAERFAAFLKDMHGRVGK